MPAKLAACWDDLQSGEPFRGIVAVEFMQAHAKDAVPFIKRNVMHPDVPSEALLMKCIHELASKQFETRQKASQQLENHLYVAEPALRQRLAKETDLETRRRIAMLLDKMPKLDGLMPIELRPLRIVGLLERIATPDANELLAWLAKNGETERVRAEAQRATRK